MTELMTFGPESRILSNNVYSRTLSPKVGVSVTVLSLQYRPDMTTDNLSGQMIVEINEPSSAIAHQSVNIQIL